MISIVIGIICFLAGVVVGMVDMARTLKKRIVKYFVSTGRTERISEEMACLIAHDRIEELSK
jgi:uncharacterized protein YneF (UPF0154 family)